MYFVARVDCCSACGRAEVGKRAHLKRWARCGMCCWRLVKPPGWANAQWQPPAAIRGRCDMLHGSLLAGETAVFGRIPVYASGRRLSTTQRDKTYV